MATIVNRNIPDYTTGTVSGTSGQAVITGLGTAWTSTDANGNIVANVFPNDRFLCGGQEIPILSVDNALQITLHYNLTSSISPGSSYAILRYTPAPTNAVLGALQSVLARNTDASPTSSVAIDNGAAREKLRVSGAGHPQLAVGAAGAADGALLGAIDIDPATGIVLFPYGIDPTEPESTIASATTTDLGSVNTMKVAISGTTTITSFGTRAHAVRFIRFTGALTLTYDATSLILPGAANVMTAAGDCAIATSDGSGNWRVRHYARAAFLNAAAAGANSDITSLAGLTTPLSVAQGGTGDTGTAWTTYTPTVTAGSGTITAYAASGAYKQIGKVVRVRLQITMTTNGTGATSLRATLPVSVLIGTTGAGSGWNDATSASCTVAVGRLSVTTVDILKYDGTYPIANGQTLWINATYESA